MDPLFVKELLKTARTFSKALTEDDIQDYWDSFIEGHKWSVWSWCMAMDSCREELKFFPKPIEIRERFVKPPEEPAEPHVRIEAPTDEEDAEIEALIADIPSARLQKACRNLLAGTAKNVYAERIVCHECRDRGVVEVYHPHTCHHAMSGELTRDKVRTCMVSCGCAKGRGLSEVRNDDKKTMRRPYTEYNPRRMCRIGLMHKATLEEFYKSHNKLGDPTTGEFGDWNNPTN